MNYNDHIEALLPAAKQCLADYRTGLRIAEVGDVASVGDGVFDDLALETTTARHESGRRGRATDGVPRVLCGHDALRRVSSIHRTGRSPGRHRCDRCRSALLFRCSLSPARVRGEPSPQPGDQADERETRRQRDARDGDRVRASSQIRPTMKML